VSRLIWEEAATPRRGVAIDLGRGGDPSTGCRDWFGKRRRPLDGVSRLVWEETATPRWGVASGNRSDVDAPGRLRVRKPTEPRTHVAALRSNPAWRLPLAAELPPNLVAPHRCRLCAEREYRARVRAACPCPARWRQTAATILPIERAQPIAALWYDAAPWTLARYPAVWSPMRALSW